MAAPLAIDYARLLAARDALAVACANRDAIKAKLRACDLETPAGRVLHKALLPAYSEALGVVEGALVEYRFAQCLPDPAPLPVRIGGTPAPWEEPPCWDWKSEQEERDIAAGRITDAYERDARPARD